MPSILANLVQIILNFIVFKIINMNKFLLLVLASFIFSSSVDSQIIWNSTIDIATSSFGNHHPRMVKDSKGNPLIIWGKSNNVMFTRSNGTSFTTPIKLNQGTVSVAEASWMGPDIAAHGDTIYVVFKQTPESINSSPVWCIRSYDGGLTFSLPVQVDNIGNNFSRFPTVTTDKSGNPIVGFMKFNSSFGKARWVVSRSVDFGNSFSTDVLASGWSRPTSEVCDCCPGAITSSGNTVAMLYRDNDDNIRDSWAGISNDLGNSFNVGMNIDQQNWNIFACPSSGPDGVILGDTLYSTYMSGAGGKTRVYFNKSSLSEMTGSPALLLTDNISGLGQQNFPRMENSGSTAAIAWKQIVNGDSQLAVSFTKDILKGFPTTHEVIAPKGTANTDLILTSKNIFVVWEDENSGTVKFRSGTYSTSSLVQETILINDLTTYPNPSTEAWIIKGNSVYPKLKVELFNSQGNLVYFNYIEKNKESFIHKIDNTHLVNGLYVLRFNYNNFQHSIKLLKE